VDSSLDEEADKAGSDVFLDDMLGKGNQSDDSDEE
jgi:hypothetical protein